MEIIEEELILQPKYSSLKRHQQSHPPLQTHHQQQQQQQQFSSNESRFDCDLNVNNNLQNDNDASEMNKENNCSVCDCEMKKMNFKNLKRSQSSSLISPSSTISSSKSIANSTSKLFQNSLTNLIDYNLITFLDLSRSRFTVIPGEIQRLKNLSSLNISNNKIETITNGSIHSETLKQLIASFNIMVINQQLIDSITNSFPNLLKLNLSYQRHQQLQSQSMSRQPSQSISCQSTQMSTQLTDLSRQTSGQLLNQTAGQLTQTSGQLSTQLLTEMSTQFQTENICDSNTLSLSSQSQSCETIDLSSTKLIEFNLSGNKLINLSEIKGNDFMKKLILHSNGLKSLPKLFNCDQLEIIDLSNNCFQDQDNEDQDDDVQNNLIANQIDQLLSHCSKLKHLDLIASNDDDKCYWHLNGSIRCCQSLSEQIELKEALNMKKNSNNNNKNNNKLIHYVDTGMLIPFCKVGIANSHNNHNTIIIESMNNSNSKEWIIGLINGTSLAPLVKSNLVNIIQQELESLSEDETETNDYLKNSILIIHKFLREKSLEGSNGFIHQLNDDKRKKKEINIVLVHLITNSFGQIKCRFACSGHQTVLKQLNIEGKQSKCHCQVISHCEGTKYEMKKCNGMSSGLIMDPVHGEIHLNTNKINANNKVNIDNSNNNNNNNKDNSSNINNNINNSKGDDNNTLVSNLSTLILAGINLIDHENEILMKIFSHSNFSEKNSHENQLSSSMTSLNDKLKMYCEEINSRNFNYNYPNDNYFQRQFNDDMNMLKRGINNNNENGFNHIDLYDNQISFGDDFLGIIIQPRQQLRSHLLNGKQKPVHQQMKMEKEKFLNSLITNQSNQFLAKFNANGIKSFNRKEKSEIIKEINFIEEDKENCHNLDPDNVLDQDVFPDGCDEDDSEKFKSWEYMLEENHKCIFEKELEIATSNSSSSNDNSTPSSNSSSRNSYHSLSKSTSTKLSSTSQFFSQPNQSLSAKIGDKISKKLAHHYDLNAFKVYKI